MPSKTLLLASLLSIMTFFQGIAALPASSTSPLTSESTNSLGSPLSSGSESTTALDQSAQATPTAVVPLAATLNSTSKPLDTGSHISSRDNGRWVAFYNDPNCDDHTRIGDQISLEKQYKRYLVNDDQTKTRFMRIYSDSPFILTWFTEENCYNDVPDPQGVVQHRWKASPGGKCIPSVGVIQSMLVMD